MKCLIAGAVYPGIVEELKKFTDVKAFDGKPLSKEEMIREIMDADVLIMCVNPKTDRDVLDVAENLKAIGVCAVGLSHVDFEYAKEKNIQVFNAPGFNTNAVAELTISKMLDISRHMIPVNQDVKVNHIWDKYKYVGRELRGKTLGVMGFDRIGRRAAELAKIFGMTIVAYDPFLKPEDFEREGVKGMGIDELIKMSDFTSLHVPLIPETRDLLNKKSIAEMKDGAVVPNMSRGGIVNERDMCEALCAGRTGGYAADVTENKPASNGPSGNDELQSPLFSCDDFVVSPHIGAQMVDALRDIGPHIIEKVKEVMNLK